MNVTPADYRSDINGQRLWSIGQTCPLPDYVKSASLDQSPTVDDPGIFADPSHRLFPCRNKAETWLAGAYFQLCKAAYPQNDQRLIQGYLDSMADFWDIRDDTDIFARKWEKAAGVNPSQADDSAFALVADVDGKKVRRMRIDSPEAAIKSAAWLRSNRAAFPFSLRKQAARKILQKLADYQEKAAAGEITVSASLKLPADVGDWLMKAAGLGFGLPIKIAEAFAQRFLMIPDTPETSELKCQVGELAKTAMVKAGSTLPKPDFLNKAAELLDAVDSAAGITRWYECGVDTPEEICFSILEKEAEAIQKGYVQLTTGNVWEIDKLAALPLKKVAQVMGNDFLGAVAIDGKIDAAKFAAVARTLPRPDAMLLERALASASLDKQAAFALAS